MKINSTHIDTWRNRALKLEAESFNNSVKPETSKIPPLFPIGQVAEKIGISKTMLIRTLNEFPDIPYEIVGKNTRKFSPEGISKIREALNKKNPKRYPSGKLEKGVVVSISNQKGGVGKTTTAVNLAAYLALYGGNIQNSDADGYRSGHKVLVIDLDPQSSTTAQFGFGDGLDIEKTSYALLTPNEEDVPDDITTLPLKTNFHNIDIIPSSLELTNADFEIPVRRIEDEDFNFYEILKNRIEELKKHYTCIIIDSPPSLNFSSFNIAAASDAIIIPMICSQASFHSLVSYLSMLTDVTSLLETVDMEEGEQREINLKKIKVVANMFKNDKDNMDIVSKIQQVFGEDFLPTPILQSAIFEQAVNEHKNIYELTNIRSRETYNRCLDSFNAFGSEVSSIINEISIPLLELE